MDFVAMTETQFTIELLQQANYRFETTFDNPAVPKLLTDEPEPLGSDSGPAPSRLLALAVANCLSASLLFAMRKFRYEPGPLRSVATTTLGRNAQQRWRITNIEVDIYLARPAAEFASLDRVLAQFEDFCVVTQSVREGIPVAVRVVDSCGKTVKPLQ